MEVLAVDTKRAGELIGLSQRTIRRYVRAKRIRAVRAGRRVCIPLTSLREFLQVETHPTPEKLQEGKGAGGS